MHKAPSEIPDSYKIAFAALDAVWREHPSEPLAIMLGEMAINPNDNVSMDPESSTTGATLQPLPQTRMS